MLLNHINELRSSIFVLRRQIQFGFLASSRKGSAANSRWKERPPGSRRSQQTTCAERHTVINGLRHLPRSLSLPKLTKHLSKKTQSRRRTLCRKKTVVVQQCDAEVWPSRHVDSSNAVGELSRAMDVVSRRIYWTLAGEAAELADAPCLPCLQPSHRPKILARQQRELDTRHNQATTSELL